MKKNEEENETNCGRCEVCDVELYTVVDIMRVFKVGKNSAYALMHSSTFPTLKINGRLFVNPRALQSWIDQNTGRTYRV